MATSPRTYILSEIVDDKPIPSKVLAYYRRRLQNRIHALVLEAFIQQEKNTGLSQQQLAARVSHRPEQINRWLSVAGNWTLNTVSDLLLGMLVDLDDPSVTPIRALLRDADQKKKASGQKPSPPQSVTHS